MYNEKSEPSGYAVNPRSKKEIRKISQNIRDLLGLHRPYINLINVLESLSTAELIEYSILDDNTLDDDEYGQTMVTDDGTPCILLEESVYNGAFRDNPFDRFTVAHELGHAILHVFELRLSRKSRDHVIKKQWFRDSEWQANVFASEFLVDDRQMHGLDDVQSIVKRFGVSSQMASIRLKNFRKERGLE